MYTKSSNSQPRTKIGKVPSSCVMPAEVRCTHPCARKRVRRTRARGRSGRQ